MLDNFNTNEFDTKYIIVPKIAEKKQLSLNLVAQKVEEIETLGCRITNILSEEDAYVIFYKKQLTLYSN